MYKKDFDSNAPTFLVNYTFFKMLLSWGGVD